MFAKLFGVKITPLSMFSVSLQSKPIFREIHAFEAVHSFVIELHQAGQQLPGGSQRIIDN